MHHIKPMLSTLVDKPFDRKGWIFEIKWDGFRAVAEINKGAVELYSRNLLPFNEHFPPVVKALQKIKNSMILDGEVVVLDKRGKSQFQLLQNYRQTGAGEGRLTYYVFDILSLNGEDLRHLPLLDRKKILKKALPKLNHVKYSDHVEEHGKKFYKLAVKQDLEGVMAKDGQSPYVTGKRTEFWQKLKVHQQQEAVVGGFTEPRGSRKKIGALVLGVYDRGKFIYIGHTGGGFNEESLNDVYKKLLPLKQKQSPFAEIVKTNAPATWVKPKLVVEVKFSEWTADGHMRQPIFLGIRPDKKATEVRREVPQ